jgi:hypothetical protein
MGALNVGHMAICLVAVLAIAGLVALVVRLARRR